jgi:hypothetical protein
LAIAVLAIGGGVFALAGRGGQKDATPAAATGSSETSPVVVTPAPADAAMVAVPTTVPVDASAPDAGVETAVAPVVIDAGIATKQTTTNVVEHKHDKRKPVVKGVSNKQGGSNASSTPVDRGD